MNTGGVNPCEYRPFMCFLLFLQEILLLGPRLLLHVHDAVSGGKFLSSDGSRAQS